MFERILLVRHGETEWSRSRRHTSVTDMPLTNAGRVQAQRIGRALRGTVFETVLSSPRRRALETATIAGLGEATIVDDLVEWDYGAVEGLTTAEISATVGHAWRIWTASAPDPVPAESIVDVGARADAVIAMLRAKADAGSDLNGEAAGIVGHVAASGSAVIFSHAHFLRILGARWLGLAPEFGSLFALDAGSISELGFEHGYPVIMSWNETPSRFVA